MGKMKEFAMDVSAELGFDGELNDDVLHEGQGRLEKRDVPIAVRTGSGTYCDSSTEFTDTVDRIRRVPRDHSGWQSVIYKGQRFRLGGGVRTQYFICVNNPIPSRTKHRVIQALIERCGCDPPVSSEEIEHERATNIPDEHT